MENTRNYIKNIYKIFGGMFVPSSGIFLATGGDMVDYHCADGHQLYIWFVYGTPHCEFVTSIFYIALWAALLTVFFLILIAIAELIRLVFIRERVVIEPTASAKSSRDGSTVYNFSLTNKDLESLTGCFAKLEVKEVYFRDGEIEYHIHPSDWYQNNILWLSGKEFMDLEPNIPEYLSVMEIGRLHFRFLSHGDTPLPAGTFEPENLSREQRVWLSDPRKFIIKITVQGKDTNGILVKIKKEFALILFIATGNFQDPPLLNPHTAIKVKDIKSHKNMEDLFDWTKP